MSCGSSSPSSSSVTESVTSCSWARPPDRGWADQSGGSWLLSSTIGDGGAHATGAIVWAVATVLFVAAGTGLLLAMEWWRPIAVVAAVVSLVGILVFWDGILTGERRAGADRRRGVIVGLLVAHWPSVDAVGA